MPLFGGDHRAVVGGEPAVGAFAVILFPGRAGLALPAAVDHAADTDDVADLVAGHTGTDRPDAAYDLVPRHAGIDGVAPFIFDLVDVRVADAAVVDFDFNFVGLRIFALEGMRFEAAEGVVGCIADGFDHEKACSLGESREVRAWALMRELGEMSSSIEAATTPKLSSTNQYVS